MNSEYGEKTKGVGAWFRYGTDTFDAVILIIRINSSQIGKIRRFKNELPNLFAKFILDIFP